MLYTVRLRLSQDGLIDAMSDMRVWLDRQGYEPDLFQYRMDADGAVLRVDFKFESPRRSCPWHHLEKRA